VICKLRISNYVFKLGNINIFNHETFYYSHLG